MSQLSLFALVPPRTAPDPSPVAPVRPVGGAVDYQAAARGLLTICRGTVPGAPYVIEPGVPTWLRSADGRAWSFGSYGAPRGWGGLTPFGWWLVARWLGDRAGVTLSLYEAVDQALRAAGLSGPREVA